MQFSCHGIFGSKLSFCMEASITYYRYFYTHITSQNPKQQILHVKTHLISLQKLIHIRNANYLFSGGGFKVHLGLFYNHFCFADNGLVHMLAFFSENMRSELETINGIDCE